MTDKNSNIPKAPLSIAILTRNSASTLPRALGSVINLGEVIVLDGGSTDGTGEIARTFGARVILQDKKFLNPDGRLKDFSGVRNQCIAASANDWILFLDSDEYVSSSLVEEIRSLVKDDVMAAVYWVPRKYVHQGKIIERSIAYPNRQMRFFNRKAVYGFRKPVHERLEFPDSTSVKILKSAILVPAELAKAARIEKMRRYIALDLDRVSPITFPIFYRTTLGTTKTILLYSFRFLKLLAPPYEGTRMPFALDFEAVFYQVMLTVSAFGRLIGTFLHPNRTYIGPKEKTDSEITGGQKKTNE
jgi:glycosyltransferase involved in cell wall biosynthesis